MLSMTKRRAPHLFMGPLAVALLVLSAGCPGPDASSSDDSEESAPAAHSHESAGEKCFICDPSLRETGRLWCREHACYEDRCWICQPDLEEKGRLYCAEHSLYEDECHLCHPELKEQGDSEGSDAEEGAPKDKEIKKSQRSTDHPKRVADASGKPTRPALFCNEHRVPERECGICQPALAASLKPGEGMKVRFVSKRSTTKAGVKTRLPARSTTAPTITAFCETRLDGNALAQMTTLTPGVVRRVLVDVGSKVESGAALVELDSPTLAQAKSQLLANRHAVELATIDLERSRALRVNTGKALRLLQDQPTLEGLEQLSGLELGLNRKDLLSAHASFVASKADYEREKHLSSRDISSKAEVQAAEAAFQTAWASYLAVRDDLAFQSKRELEAATRKLKAAEFDLESARRLLFTLGLTKEQIEAIPAQTGEALTRHTVSAPFSGTIVERKAVAGEAVEPGESLFMLADLSTMWLALSIPADRSPHIRAGLTVGVTFPELDGRAVSGKIVWVNTCIDEKTRMVHARAVVPNDGTLKAGLFGEARIVLGEAEQSLRVPRDSVQRFERQPFVFVKIEDDLYELRRVSIADKSDDGVEIIAGLEPDEPVVVSGTFIVMSEFLKSRLGAGCVDD